MQRRGLRVANLQLMRCHRRVAFSTQPDIDVEAEIPRSPAAPGCNATRIPVPDKFFAESDPMPGSSIYSVELEHISNEIYNM